MLYLDGGYAGLLTWIGMILGWFWKLLHQPAELLISAFFWGNSASRACSVPVYITVAVHMAKRRRWLLSTAGATVMGNQMYASGESVLPPFANCFKAGGKQCSAFQAKENSTELKMEMWQLKLLVWWKIVSGIHVINTDTLTVDLHTILQEATKWINNEFAVNIPWRNFEPPLFLSGLPKLLAFIVSATGCWLSRLLRNLGERKMEGMLKNASKPTVLLKICHFSWINTHGCKTLNNFQICAFIVCFVSSFETESHSLAQASLEWTI